MKQKDIRSKFSNHKNIIRLAIPIILANASAPLLGLSDTAVIGRTGTATELGAISLASLIFSFIYWGFGFLRMGTTGFISQAWGANNQTEVNLIYYRTFLTAILIGSVLIALQIPIAEVSRKLMSASPQVKSEVDNYFYIRIWGAPATLITFGIIGSLIGLGHTRQLLWIQLSLNFLNLLLNIIFVVGLKLGVKGIALGTLIAEWFALFYAIYLLHKTTQIPFSFSIIRKKWTEIINKQKIWMIFRVNLDIMLRTFALLTGFAWFANQGAKFGDSILAANHILLQFISLSAFFLDGYAHVVEMLSGKSIGAKNQKEFILQVKNSTELAAITAFMLGLGIILFGPIAIQFFSNNINVLNIAKNHVIYAGIYIMFSFAAFQLDGIFIGATQSKAMRNASIISLIILVASGTLLVQKWGNSGLWISFILYIIARGISLGLYFPQLIRSTFRN
ncbi:MULTISPECIES: MATE family efflux transporter [Weeksella]|uniref:MATE family efflux transporter n=1 Tax=Weeksella TaxID=1013 RepID=UPI0008A50296|nr:MULTISPECIES: MATE family efflux transporter [Weeksella]MDK7374599.1 MATE family efflux transporter [Weeksella virosa]OFM83083.1 MATE family efflux transporter [Weeksella sp. HMSC059D05]